MRSSTRRAPEFGRCQSASRRPLNAAISLSRYAGRGRGPRLHVMNTHRLPADVHRAIVDFTDEGRAIALAVVLDSAGSTPRKPGTKAIIDRAGSIWGTIGGGRLESDARRLAIEA